MTEYRIMAYFTQVYAPRAYKRKIVKTLEEAKKLLEEATQEYSSCKYHGYLDKIEIQSREITEWK